MEGEACAWYESGAVSSIILKNNIFLNCAYIPSWGEAPIVVCPKVEKNKIRYYHGKLELLKNEFYCFDERVLYARRIGHVLIKENKYYQTLGYPKQKGRKFDIES